ncbi:hypothetical protein AALB53_08440 [Lachnospiraceae bacterium 47-T17]
MIKLMVVAGDSSEKLAAFLEQRGTFSVDCWFQDLSNIEEVQNKIIKVDKFLYLHRPNTGSVSIKSEMQTLQQLIQSGGFFSPGEIIFIAKDSEDTALALKYFNSVMNNCNYKNFSIKQIKGILSFDAIYDSIMGTSEIKDFKNQYRRVYRVERNADSNAAYLPKNDATLVVEPFDFINISEYEERKRAAARTDSGHVHTDNKDSDLAVFESPSFSKIEYSGSVLKQRICIITGGSNSGKSVWSTVIGASANMDGHTVLIIDYTRNQDITDLCNTLHTGFIIHSIRDLLLDNNLKEATMNVCHFLGDNERGVRLEFLQNFISRMCNSNCLVIIVAELEDYEEIDRLLYDLISTRIYMVTPLKGCVNAILPLVEKHADSSSIVIMNQAVRLMNSMEYLDASDVREMLDTKIRLAKATFFDDLNKGPKVYKSIIGE